MFYFGRVYRKLIQTIKKEAKHYLKPGSRLVDIACGTGEIILHLAQDFPQVEFTGSDFSEEMLKKAKSKNADLSNVKIVNANVRDLPFPDSSFDVILCSDAFHHFASPEESLKEINRVAKEDSVFLLVDPAFDTLFQRIVAGAFGKVFETPKKYYSKNELVSLLVGAKFNVNEIFSYYFTNFLICKKRNNLGSKIKGLKK
ncbi:class I SAM-dependent methyltransferase [Patescibacteria group bacterium]|nr:class I SAM-dependent methyltransferase [Patescibacteria group bacterium]